MSKPPRKTHAMRVLDSKGVAYTATTYDSQGCFHTAEAAAELLGQPLETIYKTLVVLGESDPRHKPVLVMIPSDAQLDLKRLAEVTSDKKLRMATQREAEQLTGMKVGGISALGLKRPAAFDVYVDDRAVALQTIHISAGERGVDLLLRTDDLTAVTGARSVELA